MVDFIKKPWIGQSHRD